MGTNSTSSSSFAKIMRMSLKTEMSIPPPSERMSQTTQQLPCSHISSVKEWICLFQFSGLAKTCLIAVHLSKLLRNWVSDLFLWLISKVVSSTVPLIKKMYWTKDALLQLFKKCKQNHYSKHIRRQVCISNGDIFFFATNIWEEIYRLGFDETVSYTSILKSWNLW